MVEGREKHLTAGDEGRAWGLRYSIWRFSTKFFTPTSHTAPVSSDPELSQVVGWIICLVVRVLHRRQ